MSFKIYETNNFPVFLRLDMPPNNWATKGSHKHNYLLFMFMYILKPTICSSVWLFPRAHKLDLDSPIIGQQFAEVFVAIVSLFHHFVGNFPHGFPNSYIINCSSSPNSSPNN